MNDFKTKYKQPYHWRQADETFSHIYQKELNSWNPTNFTPEILKKFPTYFLIEWKINLKKNGCFFMFQMLSVKLLKPRIIWQFFWNF